MIGTSVPYRVPFYFVVFSGRLPEDLSDILPDDEEVPDSEGWGFLRDYGIASGMWAYFDDCLPKNFSIYWANLERSGRLFWIFI